MDLLDCQGTPIHKGDKVRFMWEAWQEDGLVFTQEGTVTRINTLTVTVDPFPIYNTRPIEYISPKNVLVLPKKG